MATWLDAVRARAEAATPGPWEEQVHDDERCASVDVLVAPTLAVVGPDEPVRGTLHTVYVVGPLESETLAFSGPDAEFIANARTDIPCLLGLVEEMAAALRAVPECAWCPGTGIRVNGSRCGKWDPHHAKVRAALARLEEGVRRWI